MAAAFYYSVFAYFIPSRQCSQWKRHDRIDINIIVAQAGSLDKTKKTGESYGTLLQPNEQSTAECLSCHENRAYVVPSFYGSNRNRELGDIFFQLRLDCPEIFYASGFHYRFYPEANKVEMTLEYLFEKVK
ncbi:MAG: hypothetical protein ACLUOI_19015 [Eisenbergiella sp.]